MSINKIGILLLNQNYEPLNVCKFRRAISLLIKNKVEVVESNSFQVRTVSSLWEVPSVIRLHYLVKRPRPNKIQISRRNILIRDNHTCQYCGKKSSDLTLDHLIPRKFGGASTWENLVSACKECNNKKGDKPLSEVNIKLKTPPRPLKYLPNVIHSLVSFPIKEEWKKYLT